MHNLYIYIFFPHPAFPQPLSPASFNFSSCPQIVALALFCFLHTHTHTHRELPLSLAIPLLTFSLVSTNVAFMLISIQRQIQEQLSRGKHLVLALIVPLENAHPSLLTLLPGLVLYQTPCSWHSVLEDISELAEIDWGGE